MIMQTITIPEQLTKEKDLMIISRREYNDLLGTQKKRKKSELDRDLDKAIKEYRQGKVIGPFSSIRELRKALEK